MGSITLDLVYIEKLLELLKGATIWFQILSNIFYEIIPISNTWATSK